MQGSSNATNCASRRRRSTGHAVLHADSQIDAGKLVSAPLHALYHTVTLQSCAGQCAATLRAGGSPGARAWRRCSRRGPPAPPPSPPSRRRSRSWATRTCGEHIPHDDINGEGESRKTQRSTTARLQLSATNPEIGDIGGASKVKLSTPYHTDMRIWHTG